ncbi:hypothetical protein PoB_001439000 [Plakobranchus ocellatus]|uniref:Uncharacterized protein n=1 Tax=Plakobranchus ocellatus TaxID=259542 RepID=A0AAV3YYB1_9GAST|nr:hypothetical protein PoB_001439000 [Plakobranchus ocellatus]
MTFTKKRGTRKAAQLDKLRRTDKPDKRPRNVTRKTNIKNKLEGNRKPPSSNSRSLRVLHLNVKGCLTLRHTELRTVLPGYVGHWRGKHAAASPSSSERTLGRPSEMYKPPVRWTSKV